MNADGTYALGYAKIPVGRGPFLGGALLLASDGTPLSGDAMTSSDSFGTNIEDLKAVGLPDGSLAVLWTIQRLLPAAKSLMATDGVHLYRYEGRRRNELSFNFRMGVSCAISADVRTPWDKH